MAEKQLAHGLWTGFATHENPFGTPNGMDENLRTLDDHLGLYTLQPVQSPGTPLPAYPMDGDGQIFSDGSYAVFNDGAWKVYGARRGITVMARDGTESWQNTGGGWKRASVLDVQPAIDAAAAAVQPYADAAAASATRAEDAATTAGTAGGAKWYPASDLLPVPVPLDGTPAVVYADPYPAANGNWVVRNGGWEMSALQTVRLSDFNGLSYRVVVVERVSGTELDLASKDIFLLIDDAKRIGYRIAPDGVHHVLGLQAGDLAISRQPNGQSLVTGPWRRDGLYTEYAIQLTGKFSDAVHVVCDDYGHVIEVVWPDGKMDSTQVVPLPPTPTNQIDFAGFYPLPDSAPGRTPAGFTCTGLDRITRGIYAGCWLFGDDGRLVDTDSSSYVPRVHVLDPECRKILATFDPGYSGSSLQGVAVDTSGGLDTFWIATGGHKWLLQFDMTGADAGDPYEWTFDSNPNGIAYDPVNDAVWVTPISGRTARLISCQAIGERLLNQVELAVSSPDQLHYDSAERILYYSTGGNGSNGRVRAYHLDTGVDRLVVNGLQHSQAIEGIYIDKALGRLFVANDAGYHVAGRPQINMLAIYEFQGVF